MAVGPRSGVDHPPIVSVVVPTFRRPELLDRCLAALTGQDLDPSYYEVIVADDAADEATRRQVEHWNADSGCSVRYLAVPATRGPAAARNTGWRAARSGVIAFTDDDCIPKPDWLRRGMAALVDGAVAAAGRVVVPLPPRPTDYQRNEAGLATAEFVTANCFVRRDVLEAAGGLDERFTSAWREDSDLHFTLLERGGRIARTSYAIVVHPVRPARWGVSLGQQRKSRFNALLYRKHPALYRRCIRPGRPWAYHATVAALATAASAAVTSRPRTAATATTVWVGLTARFCAKRLRGTSRRPLHVLEMMVTSALIPPLSVFWRLHGALRFRVLFV